MWLLGDRNDPLHPRYWTYADNKPVLANNERGKFFFKRRSHDPYHRIFYVFKNKTGENKIILNTNTPNAERQILEKFMDYFNVIKKNVLIMSIPISSGIFFSLLKQFPLKRFYQRLLLLGASFAFTSKVLNYLLCNPSSVVIDRYFTKYESIAVKDFSEVTDKRREFFRPDTKVYYRESPQEIMDSKNADQLHDASIYYGPHPFDDHENIDSVVEINKKFITGKSIYDDPEKELILSEQIDIKRKIRGVPSYEEFIKV